MLIVMPLVLGTANINIRTMPDSKISVFIRDVGSPTTIESFHKDTENGNISITSNVVQSKIDLLVILKKDGVKMINQNFEELSTLEPINIQFIPGDIKLGFEEKKEETNKTEEKINATESETKKVEQEIVEEENESSKGITGVVVEEEIKGEGKEEDYNFFKSKIFYYILIGIGIFILLLIIFFVLRMIFGVKRGYKVVKFDTSYKDEIEEAERRIEKARRELDDLKRKKDRIGNLKERLKRDEEELKKLEERY